MDLLIHAGPDHMTKVFVKITKISWEMMLLQVVDDIKVHRSLRFRVFANSQ